ncbi:SWIM zinc finger family protein [Halostella sp. JP-L12]|uniref:SWIM zinc finger family protein n=1 Tax=Halostella TaxID=1843185 RepID=UPI000EF847DD|nr:MULTISPECIES: SWIM zinc finger family protein [Halostella]NHN48004.1 SWIM zinc finger family protein [Halostella sp. JP-L12]
MTVPLAHLDVTTRVVKRAQYEAFEFTVDERGVRVRNGSHANPDEHEYLVTVDEEIPSSCECPADEHYDGACKHRVAVAIREPVLTAAIHQQVATDGGATATDDTAGESDETTDEKRSGDAANCDCEELAGDFPCWECVRTGRRELPNA